MKRIALVPLALLLSVPIEAQVGDISFETSASPEAQQHFLRGVAILHSFGFEDAIGSLSAGTDRPLRLLRRQHGARADVKIAPPREFLNDIDRAGDTKRDLDEFDSAFRSSLGER